MRMGILVPLDGQAVSKFKDYGCFQLAFAEHHHGTGHERGLTNLEIVTCDMNEFDQRHGLLKDAAARLRPSVSIEMFEHMRNWEKLLDVSAPGFMTMAVLCPCLCPRTHPYRFEDDKAEANENPRVKRHGNWMGEHFFSGGIMPSRDLFHQFSNVLEVERIGGGMAGTTAEPVRLARILTEDNRSCRLAGNSRRLSQMMLQRWRVFSWHARAFAFENRNRGCDREDAEVSGVSRPLVRMSCWSSWRPFGLLTKVIQSPQDLGFSRTNGLS